MAARQELLQRLERLGHWWFYLALRLFGQRGGYLLLWPVIGCYAIFGGKARKNLNSYLLHRFPGATSWQRFGHRFHLLLSFGQVLVDRGWLGLVKGSSFQGQFAGEQRLLELIGQGKGVVMLTAHVGNWQSALAHLDQLPVQVHALMQYDQQAAAKHFFDLGGRTRPFSIIDADGELGGMVESVAALARGEVVTIMADRYVKGPWSTVPFLGREVRVPNSAYLLAAMAGAPVAVLLAAKTGARSYHLRLWDEFVPAHRARGERDEMLAECSRRFVGVLEQYLQQYPHQWYNFYDFWKQ